MTTKQTAHLELISSIFYLQATDASERSTTAEQKTRNNLAVFDRFTDASVGSTTTEQKTRNNQAVFDRLSSRAASRTRSGAKSAGTTPTGTTNIKSTIKKKPLRNVSFDYCKVTRQLNKRRIFN